MNFYPDEDFQPETASPSFDKDSIDVSSNDKIFLPETVISIPKRCFSVQSGNYEQEVNKRNVSYYAVTPDSGEIRTESMLEKLRQIGECKSCPRNGLRKYLVEKVATGLVPNPWILEPLSEILIKKSLRRFVKFMLIKACEDIGIEDCEYSESHKKSVETIDYVNRQLISSIRTVAGFSSELMECAQNNCLKAFVSSKDASVLLSRVMGDYNHCQVPTCSARNDVDVVNTSVDRRINYIILEGGAYSSQLEMPNQETNSSTPKLLCLCNFHIAMFELMFAYMHMKWNVYQNCLHRVSTIKNEKNITDCEEIIGMVPFIVTKKLISYYMGRYFSLWAFGDAKMWKARGCTLFQSSVAGQD